MIIRSTPKKAVCDKEMKLQSNKTDLFSVKDKEINDLICTKDKEINAIRIAKDKVINDMRSANLIELKAMQSKMRLLENKTKDIKPVLKKYVFKLLFV